MTDPAASSPAAPAVDARPTRIIRLPELHPGQMEVAKSSARYRVVAAGRRWGKTRLGAVLCIKAGLQGKHAWWVAPSYPIARIGWRLLRDLGEQLGGKVRESELMIEWEQTRGWVQVKSADDPNSLRGEGLDLVVEDEAGYQEERAWVEALRPALADRGGKALFISTPAGMNWFWEVWKRGQDEDPEWKSWQLPTSSNPFIKPDEIESARKSLPERIFAQEFEAQFSSEAGAVFRGIGEAATQQPEQPVKGHVYVVGCDWGKFNDFSVFSVIDATTKRQVWQDRSNRLDYTVQARRLRSLCERYKPAGVVAEANAMGTAVIEHLRGLPVVAWTASAASKAAMIEQLMLAFEEGTLKVLKDPVLIGELQAFQSKRSVSGLMHYGGPDNGHDDTVIALGLAWLGAKAPVRRELRQHEWRMTG